MKNFILLISFLIPVFSLAQEPGEDLLEWSSSRKLTWADYKGDPNPRSDAAASTHTYLGIEYNIKRDNLTYKVRSLFSRDKSWGLHKTAYILSHEQGHFDLAEVYARKLHKKMSEYKFDRNSYQKDLRKIYEDVLEEKEKMQNDYDKETNHSILKVKQEEWLKKIRDMLDELKDYANY